MWETQRYKSAAVGGGKGFHILPFPADLRGKLEYSYFPKKISNILIRSIRIFFIFWKTYFFVFAAIKQAKNTMKRHSKTSFFLVSLRRRSNISPPPSFPHPPLRGDICRPPFLILWAIPCNFLSWLRLLSKPRMRVPPPLLQYAWPVESWCSVHLFPALKVKKILRAKNMLTEMCC